MAIDPRISMGIQVPNAGNAINIFENALNSATNRGIATNQDQRAQALAPFKQQQAQQTVDMNQQTLDQNRDVKRLTNLHQTGQLLKPFIDNQDFAGGEKFLLDNIANIQQRIASGETDLDTTESMQTLAQWQSGDIKGVLGNINAVAGLVSQSPQTRVISSKILADGTTVQSLSTGGTNVISASGDVLSGNERTDALNNALQVKVKQKGDIARVVSDVKVGEVVKLETESTEKAQEIECSCD